jgi:hypothetical protein
MQRRLVIIKEQPKRLLFLGVGNPLISSEWLLELIWHFVSLLLGEN